MIEFTVKPATRSELELRDLLLFYRGEKHETDAELCVTVSSPNNDTTLITIFADDNQRPGVLYATRRGRWWTFFLSYGETYTSNRPHAMLYRQELMFDIIALCTEWAAL